jgi:beta-mannosidase
MFSQIELELPRNLCLNSELRITVFPAPKSRNFPEDRSQANHSCKPAVSYEWDFHPRLVPLGVWDDARLEVRPLKFLVEAAVNYELNNDFSSVRLKVRPNIWANPRVPRRDQTWQARWTVQSPAKEVLVSERMPLSHGGWLGECEAEISKPELWWPHDQGNPALYTSRLELFNEAGELIEPMVGV